MLLCAFDLKDFGTPKTYLINPLMPSHISGSPAQSLAMKHKIFHISFPSLFSLTFKILCVWNTLNNPMQFKKCCLIGPIHYFCQVPSCICNIRPWNEIQKHLMPRSKQFLVFNRNFSILFICLTIKKCGISGVLYFCIPITCSPNFFVVTLS